MAITFPTNPANGDKYSGYIYNSTDNAWSKVTAGDVSSTVNYGTVNDLPLTGNNPGDQVYVTGNNRLYIWNGDGWYNIALINTAPQITQGGAGAYALANDGTPTVITLVATDPEELPITWSYSVTSGSLGNTATVSQADNVFTITPSTNSADAGTFSITFTASDGINLSTDVNSFELAFFIENSKYTSALITSVGGNGDVNNGLTDKNTTPKTLTVSDATAQTFSPYNAGGYSTYFSATNLRMYTTTNSSDFNIGTNDFSYEAWVWADPSVNFESYSRAFGLGPNYNTAGSFGLLISDVDNSNNITVYWNNGSMGRKLISSQAMAKGEWVHLVVCRESNNTALFYNGTRIASGTDSNSIGADTYAFLGHTGNGSEGFAGYIYDARFINGSSAYDPTSTSITVPTEKLTATADTKLLTARLPYPKDESASDHSWVVGGAFKPFTVFDTKEYDPAIHGASLYTASGQYITVADTDDLDMGTGDFTVEFWHYNVSTPGNYPSIVSGESWSSPSGGVAIRYNNTTAQNKVSFYWNGVGDPWLASSSDFRANEWMHIALTRSGNDFTLWVNGKQEATGSNAGSIDWCKGGDFHIHWGEWDGANGYVNGYTTDLRILKGTALYTSAFTPPTEPLEEITNTVLLVNGHDDAAIIDKAQSQSLTLVGDTQSSTTVTKYGSSSMYFDGTGDYISIPNDTIHLFGTSDFTIESWIYFTSINSSTYQTVVGSWGGSNAFNYVLQIKSDELLVSTGNAGSFGSQYSIPATFTTDQWYHIAMCREGTNLRFFLDGTQIGTTQTDSSNIVDTAPNLYIGMNQDGSTQLFNGYMEDVRLTKGLARYTENFTPPSASLKG